MSCIVRWQLNNGLVEYLYIYDIYAIYDLYGKEKSTVWPNRLNLRVLSNLRPWWFARIQVFYSLSLSGKKAGLIEKFDTDGMTY